MTRHWSVVAGLSLVLVALWHGDVKAASDYFLVFWP